MAINNVTIMGRLTADPDVRQTKGKDGTTVANFTVACNRPRYKGEDNGADFIRCTAWRGTAEFIEKWFSKGDPIALTGSIRTGSYENDNGDTVYTTEVVVNEVSFLPTQKDDSGSKGAKGNKRK